VLFAFFALRQLDRRPEKKQPSETAKEPANGGRS
jgi:hypothetical protein